MLDLIDFIDTNNDDEIEVGELISFILENFGEK